MPEPPDAVEVAAVAAAHAADYQFRQDINAFTHGYVAGHAAGLLADRERLAALERVADLAQQRRTATTGAARAALSQELFAALDALPATKTPES